MPPPQYPRLARGLLVLCVILTHHAFAQTECPAGGGDPIVLQVDSAHGADDGLGSAVGTNCPDAGASHIESETDCVEAFLALCQGPLADDLFQFGSAESAGYPLACYMTSSAGCVSNYDPADAEFDVAGTCFEECDATCQSTYPPGCTWMDTGFSTKKLVYNPILDGSTGGGLATPDEDFKPICSCAVDPCLGVDCGDHGTCAEGACICDAGWAGTNCQEDADDCIDQDCSGHGSCTDAGLNAYTCACDAGFQGENCHTNIDDCVNIECGDHSTCTDAVANYVCTCDAGYTGTNCEPQASCAAHLDAAQQAGVAALTGVYQITNGNQAYEAYCDMADGQGWELVLRVQSSAESADSPLLFASPLWTNAETLGNITNTIPDANLDTKWPSFSHTPVRC